MFARNNYIFLVVPIFGLKIKKLKYFLLKILVLLLTIVLKFLKLFKMSSLFNNCVYTATSDEGFKFRLVFTEENNVEDPDPEYGGYAAFECYDEDYIRYVYYTDASLMRAGIGRLYTKYPDGEIFEVNVTLAKTEKPLIVDCYDNLFIVDPETNKETEWTEYIGKEVLGSMSNDEGCSFEYTVKVLELKLLKSTGNYRVKMNIEGDLYPVDVCWVLLLSPKGDILKKCRAD